MSDEIEEQAAALARKQERLAAKIDLKRVLARVVYTRSLDQVTIADAAGVKESLPSRWASRRCADSVGLVDVVLVGQRFPEFAHDLLRWAGERLGLVVAKRLRATATRDHLEHVAKLARESGEVLGTYAEGTADGTWTDEELARLDRELRDLEEATAGLREWLDGERESRSVPRLGAKTKAA